ncbi:MAG: hypothetical protein C0467_29955 [Planctomycetaceae bacterium]|nr:hypothetical protein [Planctomycetaceae bacterium]
MRRSCCRSRGRTDPLLRERSVLWYSHRSGSSRSHGYIPMTARIIAIFAAYSVIALGIRADAPNADPQPKGERAEPKRVPWTTSKITGSPEPPPNFKSVRVFPEAKFTKPLQITPCPGSDRLFITEEHGKIFSLKPGAGSKPELFFDVTKELKTLDKTAGAKGLDILYGIVFHPKFEQNRYAFVCMTFKPKDPKTTPFLPDGSRISRFTVTKTDPPRLDPDSEAIIITWQGGGHNGCDMHFSPTDGMLYFSTGDGRGPNPPDPLNTGQDCSDLLSSILRIDVDNRDAGKNYAIPKDNPFVGMKDVRPEIWAFGFRNPYRMSFDRQAGDLWVGDVGWELWEMVHKIQKGGNYGWSVTEGRQPTKPTQKVGPTPILPPTLELPHTIAASVTGGYVYRGKRFPELVGAYIFGDWETRRIWAARFENGRVKEMPEIVKPNVRVSAFGEDNAGELYYLDYDTGFMYTLERNDAKGVTTAFPTKLSETGLFKDVKNLKEADGVRAFTPAVKQWQDGADGSHHVALPGTSSVTIFEKPRRLPGQVYWHDFKLQFPKDAVLVKTLKLNLEGRKSSFGEGGKKIETQVLHFDGEDWHGYTFAWREDGSDADLVPAEGTEKLLHIADARVPDGKRELTWTFPSRTQCAVCHSAWSEYSLAFNVGQLNAGDPVLRMGTNTGSPWYYSQENNELIKLSQHGFVRRVGSDDKDLPIFDAKSVEKETSFRSGAETNSKEWTERAARAYLHVNCAHCHRFGGGGGQVVLEMDFSKPLKEMGLLDVNPKQGDFSIPDARIIKSGDPHGSVLFYRMAKFGRGRMPHLGSEIPHQYGLQLMANWIEDLGGKERSKFAFSADDAEKKLLTVAGALPLASGIALFFRSKEDIESVKQVVAAAAKLEPGPVRDLFEGYLPPDPKGRKLGSNPRPQAILSLKGDVKNGEAIFFNKEMKCANCHKIGDKGTALGPELTAIGKTRTRAELLESLLQPSLQVEPQFAAYLVQTKDEKTFTGLLVKRDEKQVVLRDAENKEIVIVAENVESLRPSRLSLMPDGQMAGLLPQEAADLLEYLATRR